MNDNQKTGKYEEDRLAVLVCGDVDEYNCRHAWNHEHPNDPITKADQLDWEASLKISE